MAFPYTTTVAGLTATIRQLRSKFPSTVTADTLKKWSIASNNEAPILVVLRFLGLIDADGNKDENRSSAFHEHDDTQFAAKFEQVVREAYSELFETFGEDAWSIQRPKLIGFFRNSDSTSARVGQLQALTFVALAALAGHGEAPPVPTPGPRSTTRRDTVTGNRKPTRRLPPPDPKGDEKQPPAITLRVEVNLPVTDDQRVYDSIFKSMRTHLLNG
jgi:hypothetical protein